MKGPSAPLRVVAIVSLVVGACTSAPVPGGSVPSATGDPSSPGGSPDPFEADPDRLRVGTGAWKTDFTRASVDLAEIISGGPGKDGIPAIDEPKYESLDAALAAWGDRSPVVALEVGGQARAYPLTILMWHEIANDDLGGVPVVVTFCPLCNTGLAFERELDGTVHDFGTTGNLRFSDLVMYDRQTETWWQQATGQAIVGELTGSKLTFLPSQIVALGAFAAAYPAGDALSADTGFNRDYGLNPYGGYDTIDQNPFLFEGTPDGRLPPKERVVTVGEGEEAIGYPYTDLRTVGVAEGSLDGEPYVVFWMPGTASALDHRLIAEGKDIGGTGVYRPTVEGRTLTFARDGDDETAPIRDAETGSTWSITGLATDGELAGSQLEPVVHGDHFWFAWAAFAPETAIWSAP